MTTLTKSFTAGGVSARFSLKPGETATYDVSGTFTGIATIERAVKSEWTSEVVGTADTVMSGTIENKTLMEQIYRFRMSGTVTGTCVCVLTDVSDLVEEFKNLKGDVVLRLKDDGVEIPGTLSVTGALTSAAAPVTSSGVGAKNGSAVAAAEYGNDILHKTVLTCTALSLGSVGDEAGQGQYCGVKVYDFPEGLIMTLGAVIDGAVTLATPAINTWDGDIGLGVAAPTDHQDAADKTGQILQKTSTTTAVAKVATVDAVSAATKLTESGARWRDGTATAIDLYLNLLIDDNAAHDNTITAAFTGTITFTWINLGDK